MEGATVSFTLPASDQGGVFATGSRMEVAITRADGRAEAWGMQWNRTAGAFAIRITAAKGQARAAVVNLQTLAPSDRAAPSGQVSRGGGNHKLLWIAVAVAGGGSGGVLGPAWLTERPQVGVMLDQNGDARVVWGVAGSATLGKPILNSVLSMACSHEACVAKTAAAIVSTSASSANVASVDAPHGPAIFGGSYIYFPQPQHQFSGRRRRWRRLRLSRRRCVGAAGEWRRNRLRGRAAVPPG